MALIVKQEDDLLGGKPVRKSNYKQNEVLAYDRVEKRWRAITISPMRGQAVYVSVEDPSLTEDLQENDIWIPIV